MMVSAPEMGVLPRASLHAESLQGLQLTPTLDHQIPMSQSFDEHPLPLAVSTPTGSLTGNPHPPDDPPPLVCPCGREGESERKEEGKRSMTTTCVKDTRD